MKYIVLLRLKESEKNWADAFHSYDLEAAKAFAKSRAPYWDVLLVQEVEL